MLIKNNNKYPQKTFAFQEVFWFELGTLLRLHRYKKTRVELSYLPYFGGPCGSRQELFFIRRIRFLYTKVYNIYVALSLIKK